MEDRKITDFAYRYLRIVQFRLPTATTLPDPQVARTASIGRTFAHKFATIVARVSTMGRPPFLASCPRRYRNLTWQRLLLRVAPRLLMIQHQQKYPLLPQWRLTILQSLLCLLSLVLTTPEGACLPLAGLSTLAVAMVVRPARQGCVALLTGKPSYLLPRQTALTTSSDTAAQLRTIVARVANLSLETAPEPRSISAGTYDSTDISFVAVDFISEARKCRSV